jgi:hypothetical protein
MELSDLFRARIGGHPEFLEAVDIVKRNTIGNAWMVGKVIFKTLTSQTDGPLEQIDPTLNFVIEEKTSIEHLPQNWSTIRTRRGWAFLNMDRVIRLSPLSTLYLVEKKGLPPTIDSYFFGVPLTVHALAYDIWKNRLVGDIGLEAIDKRVVSVNNFISAKYSAEKKGLSLSEYMSMKREKLRPKPAHQQYAYSLTT